MPGADVRAPALDDVRPPTADDPAAAAPPVVGVDQDKIDKLFDAVRGADLRGADREGYDDGNSLGDTADRALLAETLRRAASADERAGFGQQARARADELFRGGHTAEDGVMAMRLMHAADAADEADLPDIRDMARRSRAVQRERMAGLTVGQLAAMGERNDGRIAVLQRRARANQLTELTQRRRLAREIAAAEQKGGLPALDRRPARPIPADDDRPSRDDAFYMSPAAVDARTRLHREEDVIRGRLARRGRSRHARDKDWARLPEIEDERASWRSQAARDEYLARTGGDRDTRTPAARRADTIREAAIERAFPGINALADGHAGAGYNRAAAIRSNLREFLDPRTRDVDADLAMSRSNLDDDDSWMRALVLGRAPVEGTGQGKRRLLDDDDVQAELERVEAGDETHPLVAFVRGRRVALGLGVGDRSPENVRDGEITSVSRGRDDSLLIGIKYRTANPLGPTRAGRARPMVEKRTVVQFRPGTAPRVCPSDRGERGEPRPGGDAVDLDALRAATASGPETRPGRDGAPDDGHHGER